MGRKPKRICPVCEIEMTRVHARPTGDTYRPAGFMCPSGHLELDESGKGRDHVFRFVLPEASEEELTHCATQRSATSDLSALRQDMADSEEIQEEYQQWLRDVRAMPAFVSESSRSAIALRQIAIAAEYALHHLRQGESGLALGLLDMLASKWKED